MKIKYTLLVLLIASLLCSMQILFASAPKLGTAGAIELTIPMGARNMGISGSNIANVGGAEAIYWNPAGAARIVQTEAVFSYLDYFADMNISYLALGSNLGNMGVLGFSLQAMDIGAIGVTTIENPEGTGESITPNFITLNATYSRQFTDRIYFGANAKLVSERIGDMSATAFGFDVGLQYTSPIGVDFGVVLKNIGTDIQFDGTGIEFDSDVTWANPNATTRKTKLDMASHELPASMGLGLAYNYDISEGHVADVSGVYVNSAYDVEKIHLGVEYGFDEMLFGRLGYSVALYPDDYPENAKEYQYGLTLGLGAHFKIGGRVLMVDYAYRAMETFDAQQYFSLGVAF